MNQKSKYNNQDIDAIVAAIKVAIDAQGIKTDLALMALGMTVSELIQQTVKPEQQVKLGQQFGAALVDSLKTQ